MAMGNNVGITIINHSCGNGSYQLSMAIYGDLGGGSLLLYPHYQPTCCELGHGRNMKIQGSVGDISMINVQNHMEATRSLIQ